ncbi:MAG: hypothetical protein BAJALOKI1v1_320023 [Promethearchaeota archaeon]|nr:MAG: hypothetical protein BAJALOKI1v1_320023 [Candidatus Lokiarchaeota archaeon]
MEKRIDQFRNSKGLRLTLEYYKGLQDFFAPYFYWISTHFQIQKVLYPGSYIHITPSFFFSEVVYVDSYKKCRLTFNDNQLSLLIDKLKFYKEKSKLRFHLKDYRSDLGEKKHNFDLIISLSSGFVSIACSEYLKKGAILLADDEHNDASRAYVSEQFNLIGVLNEQSSSNRHHSHKMKFNWKDYKSSASIAKLKQKIIQENNISFQNKHLEDYFLTTKNKRLTLHMVEEILEKSPSKLTYKLKKTANLYLFKKL